jgi:hypothetical protein
VVTFERATGRAPELPDSPPFHEWIFPDGKLWSSFFRTPRGYLLRFADIADFALADNGRHVTVWPNDGVPPDAVDLVYVNQVLPLAWSKQGRLVLHASAVEIDGRAVVFIAPSGYGKSTLAASFVLAGARLLCDDALVLEASGPGARVQPGHPSLRLWSDSEAALVGDRLERAPAVHYTTKSRFTAIDEQLLCAEPCELACGFFLGDGTSPQPSITALQGAAPLVELVKHSFILDSEERALLSTHFDALSRLASLPIYRRLDYPRTYDALPHVHDAVRRCIAALDVSDDAR